MNDMVATNYPSKTPRDNEKGALEMHLFKDFLELFTANITKIKCSRS
jgi:hypothetical protein